MATSMPPEWRPRRTVIDLYNEKDGIPWYYRFVATLSALMLALGYGRIAYHESTELTDRLCSFFILPSTYLDISNASLTPLSALGAAIVLIVFPFTICLILTIFMKSWIFRLDVLYVPHLISSLLGLLGNIYSLASSRNVFSKSNPSAHNAIAAICLAVAATLIYALLSLLTFRKIHIVRARDALHRHVTPTKEFLPETEQQRKQLLGLLLQQEESQASSPDKTTSQTFKIDWPGSNTMGNDRSHRNTLNTLRNFPRFGPTSRYTSRRNSLLGGPPLDHLTGGIERVPTVIREESTMNSTLRSGAQNLNNPPTIDPAALAPVALAPRAQSYLFNTAAIDDRSRAPSYCENAHPSMHIDVRTSALPYLQNNEYPVEKSHSHSGDDGTSRASSDQPRIEYRLATPTTVGGAAGFYAGGDRKSDASRKGDIELADRGKDGTKIRPELQGWGAPSKI